MTKKIIPGAESAQMIPEKASDAASAAANTLGVVTETSQGVFAIAAKTTLSLVLILVVIFLIAAVLKRLGLSRVGSASTGQARCVQSLSLGKNESVKILSLNGRWYVLGVTPGGISVIDEMPAIEHPEGEDTPNAIGNKRFVEYIAQAWKRTVPESARTRIGEVSKRPAKTTGAGAA